MAVAPKQVSFTACARVLEAEQVANPAAQAKA